MKFGFIIFLLSITLAGCNEKNAVEESSTSVSNVVQVHNIHELMTVVIDPQADIFWEASSTVSDNTGVHNFMPTTDEGWLRTQSAAATVAEMGNLLLSPVYAAGRGNDWTEFAKAMIQVGQQAEASVLKRDQEELLHVGAVLYNVCLACHEAYITEPASN